MALEPITRQEKIIAGQDLTPITRMEKFLKQYGGGSGGVTSWNDLTDKPFGETTTVKEVLAETVIEFDKWGDATLEAVISVSPNSPCLVYWDGVEYECVPIEFAAYGTPACVIGRGNDLGVVTPDEDKPFNFIVPLDQTADMPIMVKDYERHATRTISIRQEVTEVQKISGKYVEGMGYVEESLVKITWDGDTSGLESMYGRYYKVSDVALTVSQLIGGSITQQNADGTFTTVAIDENNAISTGGVVAVYIESGTASLMSATVDNSGGLEPGLWFYTPGSGIYTSSVSYFGETIHPIDPKFIVLTSPNGTQYNLSVADDGTLSAVAAT